MRTRTALAAALCLAALAGLSRAQESSGGADNVKVVGLQITAPPPAGEQQLSQFHQPGTTITLRVALPGGAKIVSFSEETSKLTSMLDDQHSNLLRKPPQQHAGNGMMMMMSSSSGFGMTQVAKDGSAALIDLQAPNVPQPGAKEITVAALLHFEAGGAQKDITVEHPGLNSNSTWKAGDLDLTVKKTGNADFGHGYQITVEARQDLSKLADLTFYDNAGHKLDYEEQGGSSMHFGNQWQIEKNYVFKTRPQISKIVFGVWTSLKPVTVNVHQTVSVGL